MPIRQQPKTFGQALQQFNGGRGIRSEPAIVVSVGAATAYVRTASGSVLPAQIGPGGVEVGQAVTLQDDRGRLSVVASGGTGTGASGALFTGGSAVTYTGAPSTASYLTLGSDATLSSERVFTKGSGLAATDGGAGGTYTLAVGAGNGITVNTNDVAVNQGYSFTWTATHDFTNGLYFGADVLLTRIGANVLALGTGDSFRSQSYTSGVLGWTINADGSAEFENVRVRGELSSSVFTVNEITATAGTQIITKSAGVLWDAFTTPGSIGGTGTLNAKNTDEGLSLFVNGSRLHMKRLTATGVKQAWLEVTGAPTNNTTYTAYPVTLRSGNTADDWTAGQAIVDWGPSGTGAITLSADGAIGASANMSILTHAGSPWSASTLLVRLGNLYDTYGVGPNDYYGIGIGDYNAGNGNYLKYDTSGGFQMKVGTGQVVMDGSGVRLGINSSGSVAYTEATSVGWSDTPATSGTNIATLSTARQVGGVNPGIYAGLSAVANASTVNVQLATTNTGGVFSNSILLRSGTSSESITFFTDSAIFTGGVNVGSATGAATGEVRAHELYLGTGSDVRLYRNAADVLRTPDSVIVDGTTTATGGILVGTATTIGTGQIKTSGGVNVGDTVNSVVDGGIQLARASTSESFLQFSNSDGTNKLAQVRGVNGGGLRFTNGAASTEWAKFDSSGHFTVEGSLAGTSWSAATYDASWTTSSGTGSLALASKKFGDMVFVRGRVKRTGSGQTVGTLVSGHRPTASIYRVIANFVSGTGQYDLVPIKITSGGVITVENTMPGNPEDFDISIIFSTNS